LNFKLNKAKVKKKTNPIELDSNFVGIPEQENLSTNIHYESRTRERFFINPFLSKSYQ